MGKREDALSCFSEGFNCAQSVLAAYCSDFGVDRESALRIAGAFGGGIAGTGETCGAVTGALMAIGLKYGMTDPHNLQAKEKTKELGRKFLEVFVSTYGSSKCRDLLGCDLSTQEGSEQARSEGLFKTLCPGFVGGASEILRGVL
jgi:C_GCAxxG_C_C family probable redox protein